MTSSAVFRRSAAPRAGAEASARVPATLREAIDPAWLTLALAPVSGGAPIVSVEVAETIKTMASKVRIRVLFADDPERVHAYCLKAFLDEEAAMGGGGVTDVREADFYADIAPRTTMRVPGCASVVVNRAEQRGILVMNDLVAEGARFCSALEPFTADQAALSLEQIARLHAARDVVADTPWLPCRIEQLAVQTHFKQDDVQKLLDDPRGEGLAPRTRDAGLLFAGMKALAARNVGKPQTLLHGDCHAGNIYWTADGPGFTDWQLVQRGHWALDVAYHTCAILTVETAEREERDLLDHYLDTLAAVCGEDTDRETAWDDYRAAQIYGYFHWAITRRVDPRITREFIVRLGAGVTRHETYRRLGL